MKEAASNAFRALEFLVRDGSKKLDHRPAVGNDDVASTLRAGRHVVGISMNAAC